MATEFKLSYTGSEINRRLGLIDELDARINYLEAICSDNMVYYSTLNKAVTDVNNGTLANADANKNTAVAGVYTDKDGGKNVVLLKDTTEAARVRPKVDMTINLGGHVLSANDAVCINVDGGNLVIDGRLSGSGIVQNRDASACCVQVPTSSTASLVVINGGSYTAGSVSGNCYGFNNSSNNGVSLEATNCSIHVSTQSENHKAVGVGWAGYLTLSNCDIRAYANYLYGDETYYAASSIGISAGKLRTIINDCYVFGTHSGVSNGGTLYVNGGTYEGYGHGGFYFSGTGTTSYVRNAVIRDCDMPDGYTATSQRNGAGFYIGGGEGRDNIKVYMDNCKVYGSNIDQVIVLRGSSGELNNSLYMSNSAIPEGSKIRIDNDAHKLYIGKGCNFTAENATLPSAVIATDEVYVQAA